MAKVSVVLNCYKRSRWLEEQISALDNQTVKPVEILVWKNYSENQFIEDSIKNRLVISDRFVSKLVLEGSAKALTDFQKYLRNNNMSSHMWIVARRPK